MVETMENRVVTNTEFIKPIPGGEGFTVSSLGIVRTPEGIPAKTYYSQDYHYVYCYLHGVKAKHRIHRLVLEAFEPIDNPDEMQVNHKNSLRYDNRLENLEWVTLKENIVHGRRTKGSTISFPVDMWNIVTGEKVSFNSVRETKYHTSISKSWETVLKWTTMPNDVVHHDGWRIKRKEEEWLELPEERKNPKTFLEGHKRPIAAMDLETGATYIFSSQREASRHTRVAESTISLELADGKQKLIIDRYAFKYLDEPWRKFKSIMEEIKESDPSRKPIISRDKDGNEKVYKSAADISRDLNIAKTSVLYNVNQNNGLDIDKLIYGGHGYAFRYW